MPWSGNLKKLKDFKVLKVPKPCPGPKKKPPSAKRLKGAFNILAKAVYRMNMASP
jgi:hypothetical protein